MKEQEEIFKRFLEDIKDHSMKIVRDDGVNRHLIFSNQGSSAYKFQIITIPGYLFICGDMGAYTFCRTTDMFEFFVRDDKFDSECINTGYWGEKLEAVSRNGGYKEFSFDKAKARLLQDVEYFLENLDEDIREKVSKKLREELEDEIFNGEGESEDRIREYINSFHFSFNNSIEHDPDYEDSELIEDVELEFTDSWEYNFQEFTYRYIWNCYAIVWGIQEYRKVKKEEVEI